MPTSLEGTPLPPHLDPRGRTARSARAAGQAGTARPRGWWLRLIRRLGTVAVAGAAALVLLLAATGYGLLSRADSGLARVDAFAGLTDRPGAGAAGSLNFLVVGSDGRTGMSRRDLRRLHLGTQQTAEGRRADTMLLVHVSQRHDELSVVSLPRDSYVTIPEHRAADGTEVREHRSKLNSAYAGGGPALAVATVERSTGLRVDHYVEVDFLGFEALVDSVGGVDVCSPRPLRDEKAGLTLPAGVTHVDGETGLAYVRARSVDGLADLGRIQRQQRFLGAMANRVTSRDVLLDPRVLVRFFDAALASVRTDPGLERRDLVELGARLRHVSGGQVRFLTVPVGDPSYRPGGVGAVALWDADGSRRLFSDLREDRATAQPARPSARRARAVVATVPPGQVRVQVYNGAGVDGLGGRASGDLGRRGFALAGPAQNWRTSTVTRTVIRYDSRYTESVNTLAAALPGARLEKVEGLGRTLQVVAGTSYDGARAVRVATQAGSASTSGGAPRARTAADDPCA